MDPMLLIVVLLILLWGGGFAYAPVYTSVGPLLHLVLVLAFIILLIRLIRGEQL